MWAIALEIKMGWRERRKSNSPLFTGRVFRYSKKEKPNKVQAVAPTLHRQAISARASEGWRKAARKPSSVGDGRDMYACSWLGYRKTTKTNLLSWLRIWSYMM
jgi:hypothetical protein